MNLEMHPQAGETAVIRLQTMMEPLMRRFHRQLPSCIDPPVVQVSG